MHLRVRDHSFKGERIQVQERDWDFQDQASSEDLVSLGFLCKVKEWCTLGYILFHASSFNLVFALNCIFKHQTLGIWSLKCIQKSCLRFESVLD